MKTYTLHVSNKPDKPALAIKEGFNWPAFLFFPIWAIVNQLWLFTFIFVCATGSMHWFFQSVSGGEVMGSIVFFGFQLLVGWTANDIKRFSVLTRGFKESAVLMAENKKMAVARFHTGPAPIAAAKKNNQAGGPW